MSQITIFTHGEAHRTNLPDSEVHQLKKEWENYVKTGDLPKGGLYRLETGGEILINFENVVAIVTW